MVCVLWHAVGARTVPVERFVARYQSTQRNTTYDRQLRATIVEHGASAKAVTNHEQRARAVVPHPVRLDRRESEATNKHDERRASLRAQRTQHVVLQPERGLARDDGGTLVLGCGAAWLDPAGSVVVMSGPRVTPSETEALVDRGETPPAWVAL